MKPTMTMTIASLSYLLGGEITHDDNSEAVYDCEDEPNILSCDF